MSNAGILVIFGTVAILYSLQQVVLGVLYGKFDLSSVGFSLILFIFGAFMFNKAYRAQIAAGQKADAVKRIIKTALITAAIAIVVYIAMFAFFAAFMAFMLGIVAP